MKQILFQDKESGLNHVGILMDSRLLSRNWRRENTVCYI